MHLRVHTFLTAAFACCAAATAGPLTPPIGPVTPTHKTLSDVEPRTAINATNTPGDSDSIFKIETPGSYYLTTNIIGVAGKSGIEVVANGVTIDLNGFDAQGVPGSLSAVRVVALNTGLIVVNGSVRNWGQNGLDLNNAIACLVDGVVASGNALVGIRVGDGSTITRCTATLNGSDGFLAGQSCVVSNCSAYDNVEDGIQINTGSTVVGCAALDNNASGIRGTFLCTITACSAVRNFGNGIVVGSSNLIADCTASENTLNGISAGSLNLIKNNNSSFSGSGAGDGAGINTLGSGNRIEGNNCTSGDRGIDVDLGGNIIIRNTCRANTTNYVFVSGNRYGPIVDITGGGAAAVNGSGATSTLSSTDPWANFSY